MYRDQKNIHHRWRLNFEQFLFLTCRKASAYFAYSCLRQMQPRMILLYSTSEEKRQLSQASIYVGRRHIRTCGQCWRGKQASKNLAWRKIFSYLLSTVDVDSHLTR